MLHSSSKTCTKCEGSKSLESFRKCSESPDGYDWWCKNCKSDYETARRVKRGSSKTYARRNHDVEEPFSLEAFFKSLEATSEPLASSG